jgi:hypothetical protein
MDEETFPGLRAQPLLRKVVDKGQLAYNVPSLLETREYRRKQIETLPEEFKDPAIVAEAPVRLSPKLSALCEKLYHGMA